MKNIIMFSLLLAFSLSCASEIIMKDGKLTIPGESPPESMVGPNDHKDIVRFSKILSVYDFDNDGKADKIWTYYSRGAHCCYQIEILLSTTNKKHKLPFVLDGSYRPEFNLSLPHQFNIKDFDNDGEPEIYMRIYINRHIKYDIPEAVKQKFKIKTHYILVEFKKGKPIARDFKKQIWSKCPKC